MIAAGSLNRKITLQRLTNTVDASGQKVTAWTDLKTVRASVRQRTTREFVRDFGEDDIGTITFTIRYIAGIETDDRVQFEGKSHDIKEIAEIGNKRGLELRCEAAR